MRQEDVEWFINKILEQIQAGVDNFNLQNVKENRANLARYPNDVQFNLNIEGQSVFMTIPLNRLKNNE